MPKIEKKTKEIAWIASSATAASVIVFACLMFWGDTVFEDFVFFSVVIAISPPAALAYLDYRWRKAVDERLPDLFRSIVQAQETGMTLPQALEEAAKRDYGSLTREVRKMTMQISWGMTFENALLAFGQRVRTALVQRSVPMIIEANRSGGHIEKVFGPMGKFVQTTITLNKERQTQTRPYIAIIYVAFFVFLFTVILLFKSFFVSVEELPMMGATAISEQEMQRMFFHMTEIQAFFGGLVAGKIGEGTLSAGLKHSLVLMLCGYFALTLFL